MLGFRADAIGETGIRFDPAELEDARWFTREEVGGFGRGQPFKIPYGGTIARALIEEWLEEGRCGG
jgi:NAD+ diphosphatase